MHRWSQLFIPTLREAPEDAEGASHQLLLRAGYIRQLGAGIYSYLFLGNRSINKIIAIVRDEMDRIGQEFLLPALNPREVWEESGRWSVMGDNMFRLKDRKGADLCLGMTHEQVMTSIPRTELRTSSSASGYAANLEKATSLLAPVEDLAPTGDGLPELVHTPGQRTIEEVGAFLNTQPQHQIKTMAYMVELPEADHAKLGQLRPVIVFLRGDHSLNEAKLLLIAGGELRPMTPEELQSTFNAP